MPIFGIVPRAERQERRKGKGTLTLPGESLSLCVPEDTLLNFCTSSPLNSTVLYLREELTYSTNTRAIIHIMHWAVMHSLANKSFKVGELNRKNSSVTK